MRHAMCNFGSGRGVTALGFTAALISLALSGRAGFAAEPGYDPMRLPARAPAAPIDLTITDAARSRDIPVRVYLPDGTAPVPVILFSHGLGGSREGGAYLANHWAGRGYVVVAMQHPGSDTSIWKGKPIGQRMNAMRAAADAENFMLRVKDVPAVLDGLERLNAEAGHALRGRMDVRRVGMSGHSFGAVTTQAVSGETARGTAPFTDARIAAAMPLSPSAPRRGGDPRQAFSSVKIPWMLMTGTKDVSPIGNIDLESRLSVYPALPPGGKYELVLDGAEHSAFGDTLLPGDKSRRNPNHHRAILATGTAFWDAYLRDDAEAKLWLDGDGPRGVLEKADAWQKK